MLPCTDREYRQCLTKRNGTSPVQRPHTCDRKGAMSLDLFPTPFRLQRLPV